eukprot:12390552-Ditylum_brightwellii.AAC.1
MVLPVLSALQGHPESGALWAKTVEEIIVPLRFTRTKHDNALYIGLYIGEEILICRQVDDFKFAAKNESAIRDVNASPLSAPPICPHKQY